MEPYDVNSILTQHFAAKYRQTLLDSIKFLINFCALTYCPILKYIIANQYMSFGSPNNNYDYSLGITWCQSSKEK